MSVVVLAGGTGGAKLARGLLDVVGDSLTVVANTGDDLEIYGAHVSPDPDLVSFWLADRIDERGWGLAGDTFEVMSGLGDLGVDVWFSLGDRDLAIGIERGRRLAAGESLTRAHAEIVRALGITAQVLPMCDEPVRTHVRTEAGWRGLQEFLIGDRGVGPVTDVRFDGIGDARPTGEVLDAVAAAEVIVIGPSNPVISIGPILALPGLRDALSRAPAPVVAVSPIVEGTVLKGPTEVFLDWAGVPCSAEGVAHLYGEVLDGIVADEPVAGLPALRVCTRMHAAQPRRALAEQTLAFARSL
ncbi:MAG TPA: 2-phospho-L-lactate transferase CofD family protein [Solirubrobacteraceae bacterium]|jgi:LPPG:FO 2-phospho-L-lactate transferase|nr:2-phospho-L-lactate transferase CofD family protein [Solirubrobacteraceae bacterium]